MSTAARAWLAGALLGGYLAAASCQRQIQNKKDQQAAASASASTGRLDGMQLSAARRVAVESAIAAMERSDLQRLKALDIWVKRSAQVVILEPDDVTAMELAIQCLEHVVPPPNAAAQLDALRSGQLRKQARGVCAGAALQ